MTQLEKNRMRYLEKKVKSVTLAYDLIVEENKQLKAEGNRRAAAYGASVDSRAIVKEVAELRQVLSSYGEAFRKIRRLIPDG